MNDHNDSARVRSRRVARSRRGPRSTRGPIIGAFLVGVWLAVAIAAGAPWWFTGFGVFMLAMAILQIVRRIGAGSMHADDGHRAHDGHEDHPGHDNHVSADGANEKAPRHRDDDAGPFGLKPDRVDRRSSS